MATEELSRQTPLWRLEHHLEELEAQSNLRVIPTITHEGPYVRIGEQRMLNLSSNDYLGLATDIGLRKEFIDSLTPANFLPTSSSSRLLTGNYPVYQDLEEFLARAFHTQCALLFNSGYHANIGILPAVSDSSTLILADKLVHASIIDGIRLSQAQCIRYRHNDLEQLERLVRKNRDKPQIIIVTESLFSMDGDMADLNALTAIKKRYHNVLLYVDEAHAFGIYGSEGLGCAQEAGCIENIDFLVGTFGKAIASAGAFVVCNRVIHDYLVNTMRSLIFTTALPPVNIAWTLFVLRKLAGMQQQRAYLRRISGKLREVMREKGYDCPSSSHIVPLITGENAKAVSLSQKMRQNGFYALPVRPPTVPQGTSRIRFSLTAAIKEEEMDALCKIILQL